MQIADRLGLPILIDRADVVARAKSERQSLEAAARGARYEFFARARRHFDADLVALGHTRDDQAETFLLRLLRGAGPRGLAGMHPRHGFVVRPLLACRRAELAAYLASISVPFVHDESNDDVAVPRNRVRHELIPLLEARFNPSTVGVLAHEADLARETWQWLDQVAADWIAAHVRTNGRTRTIELAPWPAIPPVLRRTVLWQVMKDVGRRPVAFEHVSAALEVAGSGGPGIVDAPGVRVQRVRGNLVLTSRSTTARNREIRNEFRLPLSVPGEVRCPGWTLSAEPVSSTERRAQLGSRVTNGDGPLALVRGNALSGRLWVRNRRAGDRFQPRGLAGHKTLQDFFVDRKIARSDRDHVPLVVDDRDRIIWVAGHRIDETFRVTDGAQPMLLLRLKQT